jgi:hypothetical protein
MDEDKIIKIEVQFPMPVVLTDNDSKRIAEVLDDICKRNCPPGHLMWVCGVGGKPLSYSVPEFDMDILHFDVSCREDYKRGTNE